MTLSAYQIKLIHDSAEDVVELADKISEAFYAKLFEVAPCARSLFPTDMAGQHIKFAIMVRELAKFAEAPHRYDKTIHALGVSHREYGAAAETYDLVSAVLLQTLGEVLQVIWTQDLHQAWGEAISHLSQQMLEAQSLAA